MDGLFGDGLVDVLRCGGDSLEEDLRWGPRLGALVDLVEFVDGVTSCGVALFKTVEALSRCAFFFSTSVELKTKGYMITLPVAMILSVLLDEWTWKRNYNKKFLTTLYF